MNRNDAEKYIGQKVLLKQGKNGTYICCLKELKLEPNKPWRAIVKVVGVMTVPDFNLADDDRFGIDTILKENDIIETPGQRIEPMSEPFHYTYTQSLAFALKEKWDEAERKNKETQTLLNFIQQEMRRIKHEDLLFEERFIYYQLVVKGKKIYIYDEQKNEALSVEGCPFEFEVKIKGNWQPAVFVSDTTFQLNNGKQIELSHGSTVRLNKSQFDPYQILLNELEAPSLTALERGLSKLGIGHEHCVYCHNSLLIQMLNSFEQKEFSGVNFISYSNNKTQFVLQHHYERSLLEHEPDITYDRFEFTSDTGERLLTTYATQL